MKKKTMVSLMQVKQVSPILFPKLLVFPSDPLQSTHLAEGERPDLFRPRLPAPESLRTPHNVPGGLRGSAQRSLDFIS